MDTTTTISALAPGWAMLKILIHAWRRQPHANSPSLAEDCAAVRALADGYRRTDPGFAADLDAAAARCEAQSELKPRHP